MNDGKPDAENAWSYLDLEPAPAWNQQQVCSPQQPGPDLQSSLAAPDPQAQLEQPVSDGGRQPFIIAVRARSAS